MSPKTGTSAGSPFDAGAGWRDTVINWDGQLKRVVDDYLPYATLDHAIQKDGIQNSWDGRRNRRRATGWRCVFELHESSDGRRFLTITDSGTTGLTGRVLSIEEYLTYLPEDERWARFESLAFTHESSESAEFLGARGQGKFIFVGSSKTRKILYDSRRPDGTYRLGARYVTRTSSPVNSWDDDEAIAKLKEYSTDLGPLTEVGTRVIVDDPLDEIVAAMLSGRMARNIADTWWPIIEKFGGDIRVAIHDPAGRRETPVSIDTELRLPVTDGERFKVWHRENSQFDFGGERYKIKRAHFVHDADGPVRPELEGIALIRGGMVVTRIEMTGVPKKIAAAVTGYVEFDEALDLEMKRLEAPTHYTFNLRRGVGQRVKHWVEDELGQFSAEKLGVGADKKEAAEKTRREAERRALDALNQKARELGLVGPRGEEGVAGQEALAEAGRDSPLPSNSTIRSCPTSKPVGSSSTTRSRMSGLAS